MNWVPNLLGLLVAIAVMIVVTLAINFVAQLILPTRADDDYPKRFVYRLLVVALHGVLAAAVYLTFLALN